MSESPVPPSSGGREPTMVSVVGSSSTDSWSSQPYASSQRIMVVDGNSIQESDVHSEDEEEEEALGVVDNITAQNFLQESDLMNAASSALGHKKSPSHDEDHLDTLLDGSAYHSGGLVPADLSPSSNSSASSLDLPSSGVGLPPVSTIIRPKSRFDAFCRPLIMGLPQFGTFDVMGDAASPMDVEAAAAMAADRHVGIDDTVLDDSHMMGDGGGHSSVMDDSHSVLMDGGGVLGLDDGRMADGGGCIKGMADVLDKDSGLSDSEFGRFDPDMQAMEEMQKVTEHLPYLVNSDEVLHFMTSSASSVVDGGSYSQRPVSAIETNVIMSTSTGSKLSAADIKALEQRLRNSQQQVDGEHATTTNLRAVEVIIPDCIVTTQRSEGAYTNVVHSVLSQHQQESESNKILKAQGILRSTIIEKNLLPQVVVKTSSESTVITSTDHPKDNTNNQLITIKTTNSPSAITASVIQQLLRAQSPPKLRTTIPRGVITSVMSSSKADPQSILVAPAAAELNGAKKDEKAAPKGKDGEHSVKEPPSKESAVVCSVLPSLFSNLSASALASLQSSLSSALPLTIQSSALGENSSAALGSPTLSSPPLSPILLPAGYGLLKSAAVKTEAGSGPLPPFTLVKQEPSSVSVSAAAVSSTPSPSAAARGIQPALSGDPAKPFRCTLCGKHLASKNVFQLHLRSHSGEKPFTCGLCGHHFSQKTSLTRHMRSHTGERPFPCDVCGKRFADKERIKIHMRTHTGEKPFACEVCGKRFSQKSTVKRHMSVHTGEKPFKCDACGKGFANRGNLNAHSKTHAST